MTSINVLIDQLNEKITKNKESAIIELEYYRSNQVYTEEINTNILEIKEEGNKKIQEITNLNDINKIIQEYKEKIDNVLEFVVKLDGVDQIVEYGKDVVLPEPEVKEGYTFVGWEGQTKEIKANGNVIAKYEKNEDLSSSSNTKDKSKAFWISIALIFSIGAMLKSRGKNE